MLTLNTDYLNHGRASLGWRYARVRQNFYRDGAALVCQRSGGSDAVRKAIRAVSVMRQLRLNCCALQGLQGIAKYA